VENQAAQRKERANPGGSPFYDAVT